MCRNWFSQFASKWKFPDNYITLDLETSGLSAEKNEICTIGYTVVRDRVPERTHELVLNWPDYPDIDHAKLRLDLQNTKTAMEAKGDTFHHTYEYLKRYGLPPLDVLQHLLELVEKAEQRNEVIVMQNGWKFDAEFVQSAIHNHLRVVYKFEDNTIYDSGICEKASQLEDRDRPLPMADETMKSFCKRIGSLRRKGVRWALHGHCEDQYGLTKLANIPGSDAHKGGADSLLIHHLFEEHRRLAESNAAD
jgi:DNA polymerase III epsilon subunit-like protein